MNTLLEIDWVSTGLEKYWTKLASPTNFPSGPSKLLIRSEPSGSATVTSSQTTRKLSASRIVRSSRLIFWRTGRQHSATLGIDPELSAAMLVISIPDPQLELPDALVRA